MRWSSLVHPIIDMITAKGKKGEKARESGAEILKEMASTLDKINSAGTGYYYLQNGKMRELDKSDLDSVYETLVQEG
jgi:hypothetical protein